VESRRYWVAPYGGTVGLLIAAMVVVACLVLWLTGRLDPVLALLIGGTAVSRFV
jgi:hypothetical protein